MLRWKPITVCLPQEYGLTTSKAIRNGPSLPKVKLIVIFERTQQLARTEEQGVKDHNARGCKTAPGGAKAARTPEGPRTGVTSFDRPQRWALECWRLPPAGRRPPHTVRGAPRCRQTPARGEGALWPPPEAPLRTWTQATSQDVGGGLHGIPPHGPEEAASARRPGQAWCRVRCHKTQANARPPPPRPAAPTSNVLRPTVPARRSTGTPPREEPWDS